MEIPYGYCHCGCGQKTRILIENDTRRGWKKGEPLRFIGCHKKRKNLPDYRYKAACMQNHPHRQQDGRTYEYILKAEKALGKFLPPGTPVHHFPSIKNFTHLVICQDETYHQLLHTRHRALLACGNPNWRKCFFCKKYDDQNNLSNRKNTFYHRSCNAYYEKCRKLSVHRQSFSDSSSPII